MTFLSVFSAVIGTVAVLAWLAVLVRLAPQGWRLLVEHFRCSSWAEIVDDLLATICFTIMIGAALFAGMLL